MHTMQNRSLFWPLVLIGVGAIWLLANVGVLSLASISVLFRLWPLILIVIGIELLYGRRSSTLGTLIALGALVLLVVLMLVGPSLGWAADMEIKTASYAETRGDAASARMNLSAGVGEIKITPLADSNNLFQADISYLGDVAFQVEGEAEKFIRLEQQGSVTLGLGFMGFLFNPNQRLEWNVGLDPALPLDLKVTAGTGSALLDLYRFDQLTNLRLDAGTGGVDVSLPRTDTPYRAEVQTGTGGGTIRIEEGAALTLDVDAGTGGFSIDVPDGAAVRLVGSTGTGGISVPGSLRRISGADERAVGDSGTWETEGFASAERQIIIQFDGGTGGLSIY